MLEEEKAKIQREKYQILIEHTTFREVVGRSLLSVSGVAQEEHEEIEAQVMKLVEAIQ
jgi:hypothetical protein